MFQIQLGRSASFVASLACFAGMALGAVEGEADAVREQNVRFARDFLASRASILIVGDSTNNPRGAGAFVPYYEGLISQLPEDIRVCGFRISGSTGNTGVHSYVRFVGGQTNRMVGGGIAVGTHADPLPGAETAPPGYRNMMTLLKGHELDDANRFGAIALTNLEGLYPEAQEWAQGSTLVFRTPFVVSGDDTMLKSIGMTRLTDHDGSAGLTVTQFDRDGAGVDIDLHADAYGLVAVDAVFPESPTPRIGVLFSGDSDSDDADESGRHLAWCDHILFNRDLADGDAGLYLDSISIGGFTARDHDDSIDPEFLRDYVSMAPRAINTVIVWLGQNAEPDEWTGQLQPVWIERIERIADRAVQAVIEADGAPPRVVLCTPPLALGTYPNDRFTQMNEALETLAQRRGWGHFDLQSMIGESLEALDPGYLGPGPHPSESGSAFFATRFYAYLDCLRSDFDADGQKTFFDVSAFLQAYIVEDESADLNGDGVFDFFDLSVFLESYEGDC